MEDAQKRELDSETKAYLAKIQRTISASKELMSQVELRRAETDRMLAAQGLTREQVEAMRFTPEQLKAANAELARRGLDTSGVVVKPTATSFTDVMSVPGGERTFFTYPGASAEWGYDDFPFEKIEAGDLVLLGYFLLLAKVDAGDGLKILKELKRIGAETAIDLVSENSDRYSLVRECLPYVDNLIVNEIEASRIAGIDGGLREVAARLLELGVQKRVVIHMPEKGVSLLRDGTWTEARSVELPNGFIKGKTGAGDAYCAGCLVGIFNGLAEKEILELGGIAAVGAMSAPGAVEGMRPIAELKALISTLTPDP
jgi:sugar/nucleoside kinase (ribokinase family)